MVNQQKIYQFKITLKNISPPIWRRVQVPAESTLYRFAAIIITTMGWHGGHLHQFRVGNTYYGIPNDEFMGGIETIDERSVLVRDLVEKQNIKRCVFDYDFGDGWEHEIICEGAVEPEENVLYPRCIKGKRACPPEDCGGPWGYADMLEILRDPKHPEHETWAEWVDEDFDPEVFDIDDLLFLPERAEELEEDWERHF